MNSVELIPQSEAAEWCELNGRIQHRTGYFFSISGIKIGAESKRFMMQSEIGLLGWIVHGNRFLVQFKFEPGNIGLVQATCTVQATKSNQIAVHGGYHPHYLEFFQDDAGNLQSENGRYLWRKQNRNCMEFVSSEPSIQPNFKWMDSESLLSLMLKDFSMTSDGRSALVCSNWIEWLPKPETGIEQSFIEGLKYSEGHFNLKTNLFEPEFLDVSVCAEPEIVWVRVKTTTREVPEWTQPLFKFPLTEIIDLFFDYGVFKIGLKKSNEPGLLGEQFGPSQRSYDWSDLNCVSTLMNSEEGGRFYRNQHLYRLIQKRPDKNDGLFWFSPGTVQLMALKSGWLTSEARTAISFLLSWIFKE